MFEASNVVGVGGERAYRDCVSYEPWDPELADLMRARQRRRIALAVIALVVVAAMIGLFTLSDFWRASNPATPTTTVEFFDV